VSARAKHLATSRKLSEALVATADHVHRQHLGGNVEREKLQWLASMIAAADPNIARQIILQWGASEEAS
jgi:hypothetical protein